MARDVSAERAVLSGLIKYGSDAYLEIADFVSADTFSVESNQVIFKCLANILKDDHVKKVDLPSILSSAAEIHLDKIFEKREEAKHLNSIMVFDVEYPNIRKFAGKIRRLQVARMIENQGEVLKQKMRECDGTETIAQLLGIAEDVIFDFTTIFDSESELKAKKIGTDVLEYVQYLEDNPVEQIGIPTGFPGYDESIGGGLNPGIAMIAARAKGGKSSIAINIAKNISETGIPTLYLDTEMVEKGKYRDITNKLLASMSSVDINRIKTGQYASSTLEREMVRSAAKKLSKLPISRVDISGKPFEDIIHVMRRWILSEVGLNPDGTAKDCVIIYDYLKVMSSEGVSDSMQEYQLLGIMMTGMQNFGVRYGVPILAFSQLNRGGLTSDSADAVAGSDRISWFCTSLSFLKIKSPEEIAEDGIEMGNRKLFTVLSRYGAGHDFGEYVNVQMNGAKSQMFEITAKKSNGFENLKNDKINNKDQRDDENGKMEEQIQF